MLRVLTVPRLLKVLVIPTWNCWCRRRRRRRLLPLLRVLPVLRVLQLLPVLRMLLRFP